MSPHDLGQILKPFVFLDLVDATKTAASDMPLHPHSGIATVRHLLEGSARYEDTNGALMRSARACRRRGACNRQGPR
jgi:redox-sensitive bicupin YhaK (pirin superfamily)